MIGTVALPRVLSIAGSDSGGGAGIQADIKTVTALGGYAMTAITALTAQNTLGVVGIHDVPPEFITQQITLVLEDIGADCIKTGMLHRADIILAIADALERYGVAIPLIVDPVMVAKGGASLLEQSATHALITRLIPLADMITPNIPEAEVLTGQPIRSLLEMKIAAEALLALGAQSVLLKGGHLEGEVLYDVLLSDREYHVFESPRIHTTHTHGTGCTLASAIATCIAGGYDHFGAVERARMYVRRAMELAPELGHGHGPLHHGHTMKSMYNND
jgi:hydroxymethylpyrimidine/phosphomethylpyrimidine kinase